MPAREFTVFTAALMSLVALSIDALLPALGFIVTDLELQNPNQGQLVITCLFLGLALGLLVCGPLSDAFGRKPILYAGFSIYLLGTAVCYFSSDIRALFIGRFIQGFGVAGPHLSAISLVRDRYQGRDMAQVMSLVMMIFILVPAIAPAIGQVILFITDWRGIFILYTCYALLLLSWVILRLPETLTKDKRIAFTRAGFFGGFKEVVSNRVTLCLIACIGLVFGCLIGYINSAQQIFQELFNTGKLFSFYFGILALMLGVSSMLNARVVQRLGMHFIASRAFSAIVISSLLFLLVQQIVVIELWMFILYAATLFFSFGLIFGNLNAMAMEPMGHIAGIASSIIGSASSLMSLTLGTIIGQLYNGTLLPITTAVLLIASLALILLSYSKRLADQEAALEVEQIATDH